MKETFTEFYEQRTGLTLGVEEVCYSAESEIQQIEVIKTDFWGKVLLLDGMIMLSEKDEFVYHEMITHPVLGIHPNPEQVLIIGGGDGGTAREVLKHPTVKRVDVVEIDQKVVEVCKQFFPGMHGFNHSAVRLHHADGFDYLDDVSQEYDIIIIDGSDPVGPAKKLFSARFYQKCSENLSSNGLIVTQSESPWLPRYQPVISDVYKTLSNHFPIVDLYLCHIPLYPTGMWSMMMASKEISPHSEESHDRISKWYEANKKTLQYFTPELATAAYALPGFVQQVLQDS